MPVLTLPIDFSYYLTASGEKNVLWGFAPIQGVLPFSCIPLHGKAMTEVSAQALAHMPASQCSLVKVRFTQACLYAAVGKIWLCKPLPKRLGSCRHPITFDQSASHLLIPALQRVMFRWTFQVDVRHRGSVPPACLGFPFPSPLPLGTRTGRGK